MFVTSDARSRVVSDAAAKVIIDEQIAPAFRAGDYARGLTSAFEKIEVLL